MVTVELDADDVVEKCLSINVILGSRRFSREVAYLIDADFFFKTFFD